MMKELSWMAPRGSILQRFWRSRSRRYHQLLGTKLFSKVFREFGSRC